MKELSFVFIFVLIVIIASAILGVQDQQSEMMGPPPEDVKINAFICGSEEIPGCK